MTATLEASKERGCLFEHNVKDAQLLHSKRVTRKYFVQRHRLFSAKCRSRKRNKIYGRASNEEGSLRVRNNDRGDRQDGRVTAIGLVALLKACAQQKDLHTGAKIHREVSRSGLHKNDVFIGTALVNLYAKCGALRTAQELFDELHVRNEVSWTALLAGYAEFGFFKEAFSCFKQMQDEGIHPNAITFSCMLKACGTSRNLDKGQELHNLILREHLVADHIELGNALVGMYAKCGALQKAQELFDELPIRDVVSWNALITGYTQNGHGEKALNCFDQMQQAGFSPNAITFVCILKACGSIGASDRGEVIHALIAREQLLETHSKVANALVDMYVKCGALEKAKDALKQVCVRNVVLWTALIAGYAQHGRSTDALDCFKLMQSEGLSPDAFTFACILKACANTKALRKGQEIHAHISSMRLLEADSVVANALVDMYVRCGALQKAQEVFDELSNRGVCLWNTIISAYAHHDLVEETWSWFHQMQAEGCLPDEVTFACVLKACSNAGAAQKGQKAHAEILRRGLHERAKEIPVALVNMYASCGVLDKAQELFDTLQVRGSLSWGTLMGGYAQLAQSQSVLNLFEIMLAEGVDPDPVLFTIVLNACCHVGLLNEGQLYFESVVHAFNIIPTLEHHTCMISLFGSAGHLEKALAVIEVTPFPVDLTMWHTLLVTCQKLGSVKLARWAFEHALRLNEDDAAAYVFTSNIGL
ncbi:hypothetical protein GOP47_0006891 [Adiantum capillus-veneris]|uniref:Pentatricopeptide repeat-containing protein n=1 Tax=Adiantum capillus-veneris TaxID=13818 RepID=A0A9D4V4A1_ADICA|nr:hypothetical protein GOP47_0006891 [Adiantum capillus-veneris]